VSIVFLSEVRVKKTRKDKRCFGCCEMIPTGSEAHVHNLSDSGQAYSLYLHPACAVIIREFESDVYDDDGIFEGAVKAWLDGIDFEGTPEEYLNHRRCQRFYDVETPDLTGGVR
jgi:hypothetical protein